MHFTFELAELMCALKCLLLSLQKNVNIGETSFCITEDIFDKTHKNSKINMFS